eukprot:CAMPEP_0118666840 /NCGR_PEP_ID=MMETSP0785-20121206/19443_1 /TAXON_ID=91992 /ORGANISM="Bolidomonas pacifica, Strain CCMP 1866" /LENGTH=351 /DNA_ID=CAMNT_0006561205 /DNA_START=71 /DNA_END=1123 /DNA_ORIENTATION=+
MIKPMIACGGMVAILCIVLTFVQANDTERNSDAMFQRYLNIDSGRQQTLMKALEEVLPLSQPFPGVPQECTTEVCLLRQLYALIHVSLTRSGALPFAEPWLRGPPGEDPRSSYDLRYLIPDWTKKDGDGQKRHEHLIGGGVKPQELLVSERHQMAKFLQYISDDSEEGSVLHNLQTGTCLEFDDTHWTEAFFRKFCDQMISCFYEPKMEKAGAFQLQDESALKEDEKHLLNTLELHFDLLNVTEAIPRNTFTLFVLNQVLEHVQNPYVALKNIFSLLRPGGIVVASTPFHAPNHGAPNDYFRYAPQGMVSVLREVGFEVQIVCVFDTSAGILAGSAVGVDAYYFTDEDLFD